MDKDYVKWNGKPMDVTGRAEEEVRTYEFLNTLGIDFVTLYHPAAFTMEECERVRDRIEAPVFKNLFLTNKQHTLFYLLMMPADKPFKTKYLSSQLGCARLSFASEEEMVEMLHIHPGAVSPLGLRNDVNGQVRLIIDSDLKDSGRYACHPCVNTASVAMTLEDLLGKVIPATGHDFTWVELPQEPE